MIYEGTVLNVIDNSKIKKVKCIKVLNVGRGNYGKAGDGILVSVQKCAYGKNVEKGRVYSAVIARTKAKSIGSSGESVRFDDNAVVMLKNQKEPLGTGVLGGIMLELRKKGYMKVVSLSLITI